MLFPTTLRSVLAVPRTPTSSLFSASTRAFSSSIPRPHVARMTLVGRLGAAPESISFPTRDGEHREVVKFVLATKSGKPSSDKESTSWWHITSFVNGPQKDYLLNLQKGYLLHVDATARMRRWEDDEGRPRTTLELTARNFDVLSKPKSESSEHVDGLGEDAGANM